MITPFLTLVLAGYAAFLTVLMVVWIRDRLGGSSGS
jgi:hypothetical protein